MSQFLLRSKEKDSRPTILVRGEHLRVLAEPLERCNHRYHREREYTVLEPGGSRQALEVKGVQQNRNLLRACDYLLSGRNYEV